ncbi:hypothetical protein KY325_01700 [Candidatus Woesearchaeota archaeon]|nr:hypothetical protein [Candidatus Woesearchaeota archaeon]
MFEDLKGIEKGREEKTREYVLEHLIEAEKEISAELLPHFKTMLRSGLRAEMHKKLKNKLKDIGFNETDLKNYIYANANRDNEINPARVLGMYTGCLLTLLTQRNKEENKETLFYINGKGNNFPYLLTHVEEFDAVVVDNFKGDRICEGIGRLGKAGFVAVKNIKGTEILHAAAHAGNIDLILAYDLEGDASLWNIASYDGNAGIAAARKIKGDRLMWDLAEGNQNPRIALVVGDNIVGDMPFVKVTDRIGNGQVNKILYGWQRGRHTVYEHKMDQDKVIDRSQSASRFVAEMKKYKIYDMFELLAEMTEENSIENINKIRALYKTVEPLLEK